MRQTIAYNNRNWSAVYINLRKAWRLQGMIVRILEQRGATVRAWGYMYKVVVKLVLLYGSKSWMVTGWVLNVLMAFHCQAARRITGMTAKRGVGRE